MTRIEFKNTDQALKTLQSAQRLANIIAAMRDLYGDKWPALRAALRAQLMRDAGGRPITEYAVEVARKADRDTRYQILAAAFDDGD